MARRALSRQEIDQAERRARGETGDEVVSVDREEDQALEDQLRAQEIMGADGGGQESEPDPDAGAAAAAEAKGEPEGQDDLAQARSNVHASRKEIIERARRKREEQEAAARGEVASEAEGEPQSEPEPEPAAEAQDVEELPALPKRKLKVNGQEREVTEDDLIAHAQRSLADEHLLDRSKQLRDEMRTGLARVEQMLQSSQRPAADQQQDEPVDERTPQTSERFTAAQRERLAELGDQFSYGETDQERVEALASILSEFGQQPAGPQVTPEEIVDAVEERFQRNAQRAESIKAYAERHPVIASDEGLARLAADRMVTLALDGLASVGISAEHMAQARANPNTAFTFIQNLRSQGYDELPELSQMSDDAAAWVEERYHLAEQAAPTAPPPQERRQPDPTSAQPAPAAPSERSERIAREKDAMRVPRRAQMPGQGRQPAAQPAVTRKSTVDRMRQQRGYIVV